VSRSISSPFQIDQLDSTIEVGQAYSCQRQLIVRLLLVQRGEHNIEDELVFTNHNGYVFHDSRGFEASSTREVKIVQEFIRRKSAERQLEDRLHAIWFVPFGYLPLQFTWFACQVLHPHGQRSATAGFRGF
jgi:hypothetical protein